MTKINDQDAVQSYIDSYSEWREALQKLRTILQTTQLKETIKWGIPIYMLDNKNIVGIGAFKSYVGLWFYQGVFLSDPHKCLVNAQDGKTKALRQMRFTSVEAIDTDTVAAYINEAIDNEKKGLRLKAEAKKTLDIPNELAQALQNSNDLKTCFEQFSNACRQEFISYLAEAKRPETRLRRLEKIIPMIMKKEKLNDKYK